MSIKKNVAYNMIYQILVMILPLVTAPYISRVLGVTGIGEYSYTYSIVTYFMMFIILGLNNYGNRTIAQVKDNPRKLSNTFLSIYYMQLAIGIIIVIIYIYYSINLSNYRNTALLQIPFVLSAVLDINWFFFGMEKFKLTIIRNLIIKVITVILIFVLVKEENDIFLYTVIMSCGACVSQIVLWPYVLKDINIVKVKVHDILRHIKPNLILFVPALNICIYKIMDKTMLGILSNVDQVGIYEYSEKILNLPVNIVNSVGTVMLPRVSNMITNKKYGETEKYLRYVLAFSTMVSLPMTFGLIEVSQYLIPIYYGEKFNECIAVLNILLPSIIFVVWGNIIRMQYLIPRHYDSVYIKSTFFGAVINVLFNLLLIPYYQGRGAAFSTLLAEISVTVFICYKTKRDINYKKYYKDNFIFLLISVLMFLLLQCLPVLESNLLNLLFRIIFGVSIYIILLFLLLKAKKEKGFIRK